MRREPDITIFASGADVGASGIGLAPSGPVPVGSRTIGLASIDTTRGAWLRWRPQPGDLRAGWVSAVVMLPQAVAFAVMAGLPPEMGIYASVLPVIVAALLGAAPQLLSGPNTAVALMMGAALLPLAAPGSPDYLALAAGLTVMVGAIQLLAALVGLGDLLALLPPFVYKGLTAGIGTVMIASQLAPAAGLLPVTEAAPWLAAWSSLLSFGAMNPCAMAVAASAVAAGVWAGRHKIGAPPLVAAMLGGTAVALLLDAVFGPAGADVERVGQLHVQLLVWTLPSFHADEWYVLKQLAHSAVVMAFVGGLQTIVISRALHAEIVCDGARSAPADAPAPTHTSGPTRAPRRELLAQGAANLCAAVTGGFAGSGSFNRTAAHVKAGAATPLAAVVSSLVLLSMAYFAGPLFVHVAAPAVAGTIMLIGWSMARSGISAICAERGFGRAAACMAVGAAVVFSAECALTLVAMLGFLSLLLGRRGDRPRAAR